MNVALRTKYSIANQSLTFANWYCSFNNVSDILLDCMGARWKLHRSFLKHSKMLSQLLERAENPKSKKQYKNKMSQRLDQFIATSDIYSEEYRVRTCRRNCFPVLYGHLPLTITSPGSFFDQSNNCARFCKLNIETKSTYNFEIFIGEWQIFVCKYWEILIDEKYLF